MNPLTNVPILDLQPELDALWSELVEATQRVMKSGHFIMGPDVRAFESEIEQFLGVKHAIACNSGTDALVMALRALGIGEGDEVITSPFSFFATAESISNVGATPVFVDVDLDSMNLDANLIEAAITDRTKAIMPVHIFGRSASMGKIMDLASRYNLKVVEDCAQSFGSKYIAPCETCCGCDNGSKVSGMYTGTMGDFGCYSFFPTKNLGCYGDGGMMTTNDDSLADMVRMLRAHGSKKKYHNEVLGYNSRLDSMQAAILRVKLPHLTSYNEGRRAAAMRYWELLKDVPQVKAPEVVNGHVFHQYTIQILEGDRDSVATVMKSQGIDTMVYYPIPQDRLPVYRGQFPTFEKSEVLAKRVLSLPIWPQISEDIQVRVVNALKLAQN
jgi:dTDP-4-amino-4,6-dideoxygalactose transaminase